MAKRIQSHPVDAAFRVAASLVGTLPAALLTAACIARFLPLSADGRFVAGYTLAMPLWVAAMCFIFLARTGLRAWLTCAAMTCLTVALAMGIPH